MSHMCSYIYAVLRVLEYWRNPTKSVACMALHLPTLPAVGSNASPGVKGERGGVGDDNTHMGAPCLGGAGVANVSPHSPFYLTYSVRLKSNTQLG